MIKAALFAAFAITSASAIAGQDEVLAAMRNITRMDNLVVKDRFKAPYGLTGYFIETQTRPGPSMLVYEDTEERFIMVGTLIGSDGKNFNLSYMSERGLQGGVGKSVQTQSPPTTPNEKSQQPTAPFTPLAPLPPAPPARSDK